MIDNQDPREVLDVSIEADTQEIRAAYIKKVKEFPPDHAPQEFERIREAYEILRDSRQRTMNMLLSANPAEPLSSLIGDEKTNRKFTGLGPWLEALKKGR